MYFHPGKRMIIKCFWHYCFIVIDKFLITGKYFKNLKSAKDFIDQINGKNDAPPAEQNGVSPSDDDEEALPKVPTKLDVITVVNGVISG